MLIKVKESESKLVEHLSFALMESTNYLELISKLRQRLLRLIKLGEPNQLRSTIQTNENINHNDSSIDHTATIESCVCRLFSNSCSVETFIQDVQRTLNVTIKSNLSFFLAETIPLAHRYLQHHQYNSHSWETFKMITLPLPVVVEYLYLSENFICTKFRCLEY